MKVRIGNDICLRVRLLGLDLNDYVNIKSVKAYLINTSRKQDFKDILEGKRREVRFVSRFPEEPKCREFRSTPHDLCHSGHPTFHVKPINFRAYYTGFGVLPHSFDPFHNHLWAYEDRCRCKDEFYPCHEYECEFPISEEVEHLDVPDPNKYRALVKATDVSNKIEVYFPAVDQHHTGTYKLIVVAKIYEPGYAPNDLRTVTMDYKEVFTIVGSSDETDAYNSKVTIDVSESTEAVDVTTNGKLTVGVGQQGYIEATVHPAAADEFGIKFEILDIDRKIIAKNSEDKHKLIFSGLLLPEGQTSMPVRVRVTSNKTPSISKEETIYVTNEEATDKYTQSTSWTQEDGKEYINLHIAGGGITQIDTSKETIWYEG